MASPLAKKDNTSPVNEYIEYSREPASHGSGTLVYLGPSEEKTTPSVMERDFCATMEIVNPDCYSSHAASSDICDALVAELGGYPDVLVPNSPRQVCYMQSDDDYDDYCCVSWSEPINGLTYGDLVPYASTILSTCTSNGISGVARNVGIAGACGLDVCLSDRGTGCT